MCCLCVCVLLVGSSGMDAAQGVQKQMLTQARSWRCVLQPCCKAPTRKPPPCERGPRCLLRSPTLCIGPGMRGLRRGPPPAWAAWPKYCWASLPALEGPRLEQSPKLDFWATSPTSVGPPTRPSASNVDGSCLDLSNRRPHLLCWVSLPAMRSPGVVARCSPVVPSQRLPIGHRPGRPATPSKGRWRRSRRAQ